MAREYNALMPGNTLVTTAFPFFQLAAPSTRELKMLGFELGCSGAGGIVSQALDVVLSRRSTASTTFANTAQNISRVDPGDSASAASLSWGISTVAGTLVENTHRWSFNTLSGLPWTPIPQLEGTLVASGFWTMNLVAAPGTATTFSMNFYFSEGFA
jgi:hypothetical protein